MQSTPAFLHFIANAWPSVFQLPTLRPSTNYAINQEQAMIKKFESTLFFAATVSALALAAVVGVQEMAVGPAVQQAVTMPTIQMEGIVVVGERVARTARHTAPEQVALVR
jgi:uncharacterized membrane protein YfbV (UPF0208 family)